nr:MAG TPA: hypothetical protein [Caudoviricetes sp.]
MPRLDSHFFHIREKLFGFSLIHVETAGGIVGVDSDSSHFETPFGYRSARCLTVKTSYQFPRN